MKRLIQSIVVILFSGLILVGCQADKVAPKENNGGNPSLAGAAGDPHPALDTVCQTSDTLFLAREDNGSLLVDKCFGFGGIPVACPAGQMPWGYLIAFEGYIDQENVVDFNFAMAPGWYCDFNRWQFGLNNTFLFTPNGIPVVGTDWGAQLVNPVQNKWQLRIPVGNLPSPTFEIALNVSAVRLNLFGAVTPGSATSLWGKNRGWNVTSGSAQSQSPWLMHFSPARCLQTPPPPVENTCATLYKGAPALSGCSTINASVSGLTGTLTYAWSTGATTPSINVCPTTNTTYSVTVSSNGTPVRINEINVNVLDVKCGNSNGNNPHHKVFVCHLPPGNPANMQEICIDWSGVAAHVASFRPAGSTQGHDSGCEIGRCGSNPCL